MDEDLFNVLCAYSTLKNCNSISLQPHISPPVLQDFLLNWILLNPHFQRYPPSQQYQNSFWKWAISLMEASNDEDFEIDSRIFDYYLSTFSKTSLQPCLPPPSPSYVTYWWSKERGDSQQACLANHYTATLLESRTMIEQGTTGLRTWPASIVLSRYLVSHSDLIARKRVLELGAGTGFLGIITASLQCLSKDEKKHNHGRSDLWLTDIDENVLSRCRKNIKLPCNLSSSHSNINYHILDWSASLNPVMSSSLSSLLHEKINPDVILGADLVYDPELIPALIGILDLVLRSNLTRSALIALAIRNGATTSEFLDMARVRLDVEDVALDWIIDTATTSTQDASEIVRIFRITAKSTA